MNQKEYIKNLEKLNDYVEKISTESNVPIIDVMQLIYNYLFSIEQTNPNFSFQTKVEKLQKHVEHLQMNEKGLAKEYKLLHEQKSNAENNINAYNTHINQLKEEIVLLEQSKISVTKKYNTTFSKKTLLEEDNQKINVAIPKLQEQIEALRAENDKLNAEKERLKSEIKKASKEKEVLNYDIKNYRVNVNSSDSASSFVNILLMIFTILGLILAMYLAINFLPQKK